MRMLVRVAIPLALAICLLWGAAALAAPCASDTIPNAQPPAAAAAAQQNTLTNLAARNQQKDTVKAAVDTTKVQNRVAPVAKSYVIATDVDITFGNRIDLTTIAGKGWTLTNGVSIDRKQYRQQKLQDLSESFMNQAAKVQPGFYTAVLSIGENYRKSKTLSLGRFGQDVIFDTEDANLALSLAKPILWSSSSKLGVTGDVKRGLNDFKYDRDLSGSGTGSLNYGLTLFDSPLNVGGGVGGSMKGETSDIGKKRFGPMRSDADTLNASMTYGEGSSKALSVTYSIYNAVDRKVMPPLGNTYEVLNDPSAANQEEARSRVEDLSVRSFTQPLSFLSLDLKYDHSSNDSKYKIQPRLSSSSSDNTLAATANYMYASNGSMKWSVSSSEDVFDYGPLSLSSYKEDKHLVGVGITQMIGDSVSVTANGSGSLRQQFYKNYTQNPRDADYLYYHGDMNVRAPFGKITTNVNMAAERYETINIDATLSGDNRVGYKYQVEPVITVRPASWVTVTQDYMIKIEYTEFVFTADQNYLNRSTSVATQANFSLFRALTFLFSHNYLMRDTGSYLQRPEGERYSPTNDTREHSLDLKLGYEVYPGLSLNVDNEYKIQYNDVFGAIGDRRITLYTTTFQSGGLRTGFTEKKTYGDIGEIALDVAYVRNYGPYITPERKEYVEANSAVTLKF
ncbi:MAG: hypothetical protein ABR899_09445 [Candidatus Krumholzibacteriaceae bacterium]|jgi:hypothetical protein